MDSATRTGRTLGLGTYLGFAMGSLATGSFSTVPGLLLLYYLTDTLGVPAGVAGATVLFPKIWDLFWNPMVGAWSDRTNTRWGARRPWMLAGAVALPGLFVAMFASPVSMTMPAAAAWTGLAFLGSAATYAMFQVPYVSMPAEMTEDYNERTTIVSYRIVALTIGILAAGAVAPWVVNRAGGGRAGYFQMGIAVAAFQLFGMLGAIVGTRRCPTAAKPSGAGSLLVAVRVARRNPWFLPLWICFVVQALANAATLAAIPYYSKYILHWPQATTPLFVGLVAPAIVVMPAWTWYARRAGKKRGYVAASLFYAVASAGLVAGRVLPFPAVMALVVVAGIGYSGMQVFPLAMLPDTIAADEARSGVRRAGLLTGLWTAGETGAFAIGPSLVGALLALTGFVSTTNGAVVEQPDSAGAGIVLAFGALPALAMLASLWPLRRYDLTAERLAQVVAAGAQAEEAPAAAAAANTT